MNCTYAPERPFELSLFLFYSMDKPAQQFDDINRILIRPASKIVPGLFDCSRESYAVTILVVWFFLFLFVFSGDCIRKEYSEVVHSESGIELLQEIFRFFSVEV